MTPGSRSSALLVLVVAILGHAWILTLPFRLDDVIQLPEAEAKLADEVDALLGRDDAVPRVRADSRHRFRPLLWLGFLAEAKLPAPLAPWPSYALSLLVHAAATVIAYRLLLRLLGPRAALAGGLVMALNPAGSQALSWIAARGDLLLGLFGALSALLLTPPPGTARTGIPLRRFLAAGIAAAAAVLSKDSGLALLPVLVVFALARVERDLRALPPLVVFGLPLLGALLWRRAYLGTFAASYTTGGEAAATRLFDLVPAAPHLVGYLVAPFRTAADLGEFQAWSLRSSGLEASTFQSGAALGAALLVAVATFRQGQGFRLLAAIAALGALLVPVVFLFRPGQGDDIGRAFYPAMPAFAAVVGLTVDAGVRATPGRRLRRGLVLVGLAAFTGLGLDAFVQGIRCELAAGRRLVADAAEIEAAAKTIPEGGLVLVAGAPLHRFGVMALGDQLPLRFLPPFVPVPLRVEHFYSLADVLPSPRLATEPGPIRVLWDDGDVLRPTGPELGPLPATLPPLRRQPGTAWFAPVDPVPARAVGGVRVRAAPEFARTTAVVVRTEAGDATWPFEAGALAVTDEFLLFDDHPELRLGGALRSVEIQGLGADEDLATPPELVREAPRLQITAPADGSTYVLGAPLWFTFQDLRAAARYRLELRIVVPGERQFVMSYGIERADITPQPGGLSGYIPLPHHRLGGTFDELRFERIPELHEAYGRPFGLDRLDFRWSLAALGDRGQLLARSPWWSFTYRP